MKNEPTILRSGIAVARPAPGGIPPGRLHGGAPRRLMDQFSRLEFGAIGRFFVNQRPSFWLICMYLLFEYVRPQSIYTSIDILPWAQWSILGCAGALVLEGRAMRKLHVGDKWLLFFTVVVLASSVFAVRPFVSYNSLSVFLTWVLIYWLITNSVDSEERFFIFMGLFLLFSLKMSQHATRSWAGGGFAFRDWGAVGAPGWFHNSGEMAIQMAIFLPLSLYFVQALRPQLKQLGRLKLLLLLILPTTAGIALLASSSRGGQLGGIAVVLWMIIKSRRRARGLVLAAVVALGTMALLPSEQRARFTEMGSDETSQQRLTLWTYGIEITNDHPVLGVGYDNWLSYYVDHYPLLGRYPLLPHNIFIEASSEMGYIGLLAFVALILTTLRLNGRTRRLAGRTPDGRFLYYMAHGLDAGMIGYLVSGFFVTVLFYPYFWINLAMTSALYGIAVKRRRQGAPARPPLPRPGHPAERGKRRSGLVPARSG